MNKWDILTLTQPSRTRFLARLQALLRPQLEEHKDVHLITSIFDKRYDLGTNRQIMIDSSGAEWISFVDDDDLVSPFYVDTIRPLLDEPIDYVGFKLQYFSDGVKQKPTFHSLQYKNWNADQSGFYRDISHVNPIRRDLALQVKMSGGIGEDSRWSDGMRKLGIVKNERYIDQVMYYYLYRSDKNDNLPPQPPTFQASALPTVEPGDEWRVCPVCKGTSCSLAGGMKNCNSCGYRWD